MVDVPGPSIGPPSTDNHCNCTALHCILDGLIAAITRMVEETPLVYDPFCGSGNVDIAAIRLI